MPIQKLTFRPGIVREATNYTNEGGWFDGNLIRFRAGMPESIGGWQKVLPDKFLGTCRSMHDWTSLSQKRYLSLGTHLKFYIFWGATFYDITPLRTTQTPIPLNPIYTTGNTTLRINHPTHEATINDFVRFTGAVAWDVYSASELNQEFQIIEVLDNDNYLIETGKQNSAPLTPEVGGGGNVVASYQIPTGLDNAIIGTGWGSSPWGMPLGWGESYTPPSLGLVPYNQLRLWSQDNYGEDLFFCIRDGPLYYWDADLDDVDKPAQEMRFRTEKFPKEVPLLASVVLMSEADRHMVAIGTNHIGDDFLDPLFVRWSNQEDPFDWEVRRDNTAGDYMLSSGSAIMAGLRTRQEILIWTDRNLHSMRFIGPPYVFGFNLLAEAVSTMSPNAVLNASGRTWWMDRGGFYVYSGQVQEVPCTVRDYVLGDLNYAQGLKIFAAHNYNFQEITWYYPSAKSMEIDRYVTLNYLDMNWSIGELERTAWKDPGWSSFPMATSDGHLYYHEYGFDADTLPLMPWVESSDVDIDDGDKFMFIRRLIPDVHFRGSAELQSVGVSLRTRRSPGDFYSINAMANITAATRDCWVRARGRQLSLRFQSESMGTSWRLGSVRLDMQPDGKR